MWDCHSPLLSFQDRLRASESTVKGTPSRVLRVSASVPKKPIKSTEFWYTIKSSVFCSRFSRGTLKGVGFCSQCQGLLIMEAPWNGGTVNLEGPVVQGKQKSRRARVRRAQRVTPSRAREKKGQIGDVDQNGGSGLPGG